MIGDKVEGGTAEVLVKTFTSPNKTQGFLLRLTVVAFNTGERAAGVTDCTC